MPLPVIVIAMTVLAIVATITVITQLAPMLWPDVSVYVSPDWVVSSGPVVLGASLITIGALFVPSVGAGRALNSIWRNQLIVATGVVTLYILYVVALLIGVVTSTDL